MNIYILLFDNFRTLDVFGPVDVFGEVSEFTLHYCSLVGGLVYSSHHVPIMTEVMPLTIFSDSIIFIPGGIGTRSLVNDVGFTKALTHIIPQASYCLTVYTGSALVAKTGLLEGKTATSNKKAWSWVTSVNPQVNWQYHARWCIDVCFYTSSGISAGTDMALGFVADLYGQERSRLIADSMEYVWNNQSYNDPFAEPM
ncbi:Transcriptional regulator GlxA [Commensalibacter communis]|uniref:Contains an amidase domain and an AraC-type DNA-binding HTH domain (GlxA) n=1 Tax=Commensalibacter communis TaxID=2972786 RepID=A0A9W4TN02_9PROT|nr:DJ-1/PfpI family protein [Commensalibacter communis]CAI3929065.1 Transcriptional regulator GlxA [Commensalibacter communis]CAI3930545.1 Transcriptional regulator GlxA [Commensalibacter communis]CAI3931919.1 Transcriptional regulator GlxA [Commensalibacter communis]CAI3932458.1 Transcriptional regulator GlxA [Commensalibacter communis]